METMRRLSMERSALGMSAVHAQTERFSEGVRLIFESWTALRLAVDADWSDDGLSQDNPGGFVDVFVVSWHRGAFVALPPPPSLFI